jgi:hypothetical protein
MAIPYPEAVRDDLARWLAAGGTLPGWCRRNAINRKTARRWSESPAFRRRVEALRLRAAERAIGRMARHLGKAVDTAGRLVERGQDDRVKLAAATTLIDQMLGLDGRAGMAARIRRLEERLAALGKRD